MTNNSHNILAYKISLTKKYQFSLHSISNQSTYTETHELIVILYYIFTDN